MPKTTQLTLKLESKPGVLAKLSRVLADAGVNITALDAAETAGRGKIRLIVSDTARGREALKAARYRFTEEPALTLTLEDRPGALAAVAEKLAQAKVNVKSLYATSVGSGRAMVVLTATNIEKVQGLVGG